MKNQNFLLLYRAKKLFIFLLNIVLIFAFCGCNKNNKNDEKLKSFSVNITDTATIIQEPNDDGKISLFCEQKYFIIIRGKTNTGGNFAFEPDKLILTHNQSLLHIHKETNTLVMWGLSENSTVLTVSYENFSVTLNLTFLQNNKGKSDQTTIYISDTLPFETYDKNQSDIENYSITKKTSPLNINKITAEQSFSKVATNSSNSYTSENIFYFLYEKSFTSVSNFFIIDFAQYYTQAFDEDLQKLKNGDITAAEIYNKYGTDIVVSVIETVFCQINVQIVDYISEYDYSNMFSEINTYFVHGQKRDSFDINLKQVNLIVNCITSMKQNENVNSWQEILSAFNQQIHDQAYQTVMTVKDSRPLYEIVTDQELNTILKNYYKENII